MRLVSNFPTIKRVTYLLYFIIQHQLLFVLRLLIKVITIKYFVRSFFMRFIPLYVKLSLFA